MLNGAKESGKRAPDKIAMITKIILFRFCFLLECMVDFESEKLKFMGEYDKVVLIAMADIGYPILL